MSREAKLPPLAEGQGHAAIRRGHVEVPISAELSFSGCECPLWVKSGRVTGPRESPLWQVKRTYRALPPSQFIDACRKGTLVAGDDIIFTLLGTSLQATYPARSSLTVSLSLVAVIEYLIKGDGADLGRKIAEQFGKNADLLFEISVKSNLLILLYEPGDDHCSVKWSNSDLCRRLAQEAIRLLG